MTTSREPCAILAWLALGAVLGAAILWAWGPVLGWGFTDADAWADVAWARLPLRDQLAVPLTGGVAGDFANFWRPAAMVQFWLQRQLFGWNAAGWHAWDLGLHGLATGVAALLASRLARWVGYPPWRFTAVVALLFAVHPLAEEVVPAVARNLDPLLGLGFFGALAALVELERRRRLGLPAWGSLAAFLACTALALGAKEMAALLAPLAVLWVFFFRGDLPWRSRIRESLVPGVPAAALTLAWFLQRHAVLGGLGGYHGDDADPWRWLVGALRIAFVEPFVPSLATVLKPLPGWVLVPGIVVLWCVVAYGAARSPLRRVAAFGAAWFLVSILLLGVTGTCSRRVLYVPTLPGLLVIVAAMDFAWSRRSRVGIPLSLAWLATFAHGSPAGKRYPEWGEVARADAAWQATDAWARLPAGATIWLVDRPFRVDLDPRRFRFWSGRGHCHGATSYSVEAWLDEAFPAQDLSVRTLTGWNLLRPVSEQGVEIRETDGVLRVRHTGGERPDWTIRSPFRVTDDDGVLTIRPGRAVPPGTVVAVWTREGPWVWRPE